MCLQRSGLDLLFALFAPTLLRETLVVPVTLKRFPRRVGLEGRQIGPNAGSPTEDVRRCDPTEPSTEPGRGSPDLVSELHAGTPVECIDQRCPSRLEAITFMSGEEHPDDRRVAKPHVPDRRLVDHLSPSVRDRTGNDALRAHLSTMRGHANSTQARVHGGSDPTRYTQDRHRRARFQATFSLRPSARKPD